jgi:hypothetical protein
MILHHHDLEVELDNAWCSEAEMAGYVPAGTAYGVDRSATNGQRVLVSAQAIRPAGKVHC